MKQKIKAELSENKNYILMSLGITILTMLPQFIFSPSLKHNAFLVLTFTLLFMMAKFSRIIFTIFVFLINITNILIGHIAMHWDYSNADIAPRLEVAILSPVYEAMEYMDTYIDYRDILIVIYTLFVLYILFKFIVHFSHTFKILKIIGLSLFISILVSANLYEHSINKMEPISIPNKCLKIIKNTKYHKLTEQREAYLKTLNNDVRSNSNALYDKVIVVMGESANKHHMSVYGYEIDTTPFLTSLAKKNYLYPFNAIAPTNQTRYSVPIQLTKAHVHDFLNLYLNSTSIVSDFHVNGYKTYWISNQGRGGKHDTYIASLADEADVQIFANSGHFSKAKKDDVILEKLNMIKNTHLKEMYVIHLMGSHAAYSKRYTKDTALYKKAKNIFEEYDNSIYYTDYILSQIYDMFKDQKFLFVYLSDHAEIVNGHKNGHGFFPAFKDEFDIPYIVYSSIKNPRIEALYQKNKRNYFNAENFNYFIEYISGISDEENISTSEKVFTLEPKNILNYDSLDFYK